MNNYMTLEQLYLDCEITNSSNLPESVWSGSQYQINEFDQSERLKLVN